MRRTCLLQTPGAMVVATEIGPLYFRVPSSSSLVLVLRIFRRNPGNPVTAKLPSGTLCSNCPLGPVFWILWVRDININQTTKPVPK